MTDQPTRPAAPATTGSAREILPVLLTADPYIPEAHDHEDDTDTTDRDALHEQFKQAIRTAREDGAMSAGDLAHEVQDVHEQATERLLAEVDRLRTERDACAESLLAAQGDLAAEAQRADRAEAERDALRERVAELETGRDAHRASVLREAADALDESKRLRDLTDDHMHDVYAAADELRRMADTAAPAGAEDGDR